MKKSLIAMAVMAASGAAMAQSSVTLFGIVDLAVSRINASGVGHKWGMSSGSQSTSRLGFRGTEDLGGGMAASFWVEGEIFADDGNGTNAFNFVRRSTVSLSGNFGEVRLGRDFIPTYLNVTGFDVFGTRGVAASKAASNIAGGSQLFTNNGAVRASNMVQYYLPKTLGGFYGNASYAFGEAQSNQVNDKNGNMWGGRIGYANGPINVSAAYSELKQFAGAAAGTAPATVRGRDVKIANIAGSYDFGVVRLFGFVGREKVDNTVVTAAATNAVTSSVIGISAPLGAGVLRASYGHYDSKGNNNDTNKFGIGYGYNLSKRTQVYATVATLRNKGTGAVGANSISEAGLALAGAAGARRNTGFDIGVRHSF